MDAEVSHGGKEGGDGAEGGEAVAELDRQLTDRRAIYFLEVHREIAREKEKIAKGL